MTMPQVHHINQVIDHVHSIRAGGGMAPPTRIENVDPRTPDEIAKMEAMAKAGLLTEGAIQALEPAEPLEFVEVTDDPEDLPQAAHPLAREQRMEQRIVARARATQPMQGIPDAILLDDTRLVRFKGHTLQLTEPDHKAITRLVLKAVKKSVAAQLRALEDSLNEPKVPKEVSRQRGVRGRNRRRRNVVPAPSSETTEVAEPVASDAL